MPLFIASGVVGLAFFAWSALFGDHDLGHDHDFGGDHDHGGASVFSAFNIGWFLVGFGGVGTLLRANYVSMPISTALAVMTGFLCLMGAFLIMRAMHKQQGDSTVTNERVMNSQGIVVMTIPEDGVGKIQCSVAGSSHEFLARSTNAPLKEGSVVKIIAEHGGVYTVEPQPKGERK